MLVETSSKYQRTKPKAYHPAMARTVQSMFQIITGCVSNPTPGRHEKSVCTFCPHDFLPTPSINSGTGLSQLDKLFLGKTLPTPALKESETVPPHIGIYQVADVVGHRRGQGRHSSHNCIYRLRLKGFGPEVDREYRAHQVSQCQTRIAAYRAQHQLEKITPPPYNKRKHLASKDGNPFGSDIAPKDGSPLESEPAIRKRKSRSGLNKEKNNLKRRT